MYWVIQSVSKQWLQTMRSHCLIFVILPAPKIGHQTKRQHRAPVLEDPITP